MFNFMLLFVSPPQAKHIEFNPIRGDDVHLPDGIVFVIANSLVGFTFRFPLNSKDCRACFSVNSENLEQNIPSEKNSVDCLDVLCL